jgi:hypothetical protein
VFDPRHTAVHEAGHVVAAARLDIPHDDATVVADESSAGSVTVPGVRDAWTAEQAQAMALVYCAGNAASIAAGYDEATASLGCGSDFENAELLVEQWNLAGGIEERKAAAVRLMSTPENVRAVQVVADHLLAHRTLDWDYLQRVLELADGECTDEEFRQYRQFREPEGTSE